MDNGSLNPALGPNASQENEGQLLNWLRENAALLTAHLKNKGNMVDFFMKALFDEKSGELFMETRGKCNQTRSIVVDLGDMIDKTIRTLIDMKQELYQGVGMPYLSLKQNAANRWIEAGTQTAIVSHQDGSFTIDEAGALAGHHGPFVNKWMATETQTDVRTVINQFSQTEDCGPPLPLAQSDVSTSTSCLQAALRISEETQTEGNDSLTVEKTGIQEVLQIVTENGHSVDPASSNLRDDIQEEELAPEIMDFILDEDPALIDMELLNPEIKMEVFNEYVNFDPTNGVGANLFGNNAKRPDQNQHPAALEVDQIELNRPAEQAGVSASNPANVVVQENINEDLQEDIKSPQSEGIARVEVEGVPIEAGISCEEANDVYDDIEGERLNLECRVEMTRLDKRILEILREKKRIKFDESEEVATEVSNLPKRGHDENIAGILKKLNNIGKTNKAAVPTCSRSSAAANRRQGQRMAQSDEEQHLGRESSESDDEDELEVPPLNGPLNKLNRNGNVASADDERPIGGRCDIENGETGFCRRASECDVEESQPGISTSLNDSCKSYSANEPAVAVVQEDELSNDLMQNLLHVQQSVNDEKDCMDLLLLDTSPGSELEQTNQDEKEQDEDNEHVIPYLPSDCRLTTSNGTESTATVAPYSPNVSREHAVGEKQRRENRQEKHKRVVKQKRPRFKRSVEDGETDSDNDDRPKMKRLKEQQLEDPCVHLSTVVVEMGDNDLDVKPLIGNSQTEMEAQASQWGIHVTEDEVHVVEQSQKGPGRKNIRKICTKQELRRKTREAQKQEQDRIARVAKNNAKIGDLVQDGRLVLDKAGDKIICVDAEFTNVLKEHQKEALKFMWDNCFESLTEYNKEGSKNRGGKGCVVAHWMGLGKTLSAITFARTLLLSQHLKIKKILILCPVNTFTNWTLELTHWLKQDLKMEKIKIHLLRKDKTHDVADKIQSWAESDGIGLISFQTFKLLVTNLTIDPRGKKGPKTTVTRTAIRKGLLNSDVVIIDEGHYLKNRDTVIARATSKITTKRRIMLSGTPMQNNLVEYYAMIQFVKPDLLGTEEEFKRNFHYPIINGQMQDSTPKDISIMKKRSHVLFKQVEGTVHRRDYSVLRPFLPSKFEFILFLRMAPLQEQLYMKCIEIVTSNATDMKKIFPVIHELYRLLCHPLALNMKDPGPDKSSKSKRAKELANALEQLDQYFASAELCLDEATANESQPLDLTHQPGLLDTSLQSQGSSTSQAVSWKTTFRQAFEDMVKDKDISALEHSTKMVVLMQIIQECVKNDEKLLIFSQFTYSLKIIEDFLQKLLVSREGEPSEYWKKNKDYFVLKGDVDETRRARNNKKFNECTRAKVYLISTRAGCHGINLVSANRAVLMDASFNPANDLQSIYRIYRLGQQKPCYIYRLFTREGIDQKLYYKQLIKLCVAERVVDDHGTERNVTTESIKNVVGYKPEDPQNPPRIEPPEDNLLLKLLESHRQHIYEYKEHDTLVGNNDDELLTEEERHAAIQEYEEELRRKEDEDLRQDLRMEDQNQTAQMPSTSNAFNLEIAQLLEQLSRTC